jgi:hypothetical protein
MTSRGLGDSAWRFQLPLQFGKTMGHWYHFTEVGYQWVFKREISDSAYSGAGTLYAFNSQWALGTELFGSVPIDNSDGWQLLTTIGGVHTFNDHWQIKLSISHTLRNSTLGGPTPAGVFYVVTNF